MTPLEHVGSLLGLLLVGLFAWRACTVRKKRSASDCYIAELRKAKARRTSMNLGEAQWLTRAR